MTARCLGLGLFALLLAGSPADAQPGGAPFARQEYTCGNCKAKLGGRVERCPKCGVVFDYIVDQDTGQKKRTTAGKVGDAVGVFVGVAIGVLLVSLLLLYGVIRLLVYLANESARKRRAAKRAKRRRPD